MSPAAPLVFPSFDRSKRHILALDGGGVRGVLTLAMLDGFERRSGLRCADAFDFFAGTSTGGIIAALLAFARMSAAEILDLYQGMVGNIFRRTLRSSSFLRLFFRRMYGRDSAVAQLEARLGDLRLRDLATRNGHPQGIMLTTHDLVRNEELFLSSYPFKTGKPNIALDWKVRDAVAATALSAPWYFGPWDGRYIDGGTTVFNTPARQAAFEALDYCAQPAFVSGNTVLWSFGTGSFASNVRVREADRWWPWNWAQRLLTDIQGDAEADQLFGCRRLAANGDIDFYRFDVEITIESMVRDYGFAASDVPPLPIPLDAADAVGFLRELGRRVVRRE
ncbi:MAG TPA: patatin-like phospholipase family protein [Thermoanaerobaculia bacterium]|nr:patatin-like phospholipase family protein [Thermoanaerobaculia bacterium]